MSELKLKQLQFETETWKRLLGFMTDENIHNKNRLSEILKNNFDNNLLEEIEIIHTNFIREDERIVFLKEEINRLEQSLVKEILEEGKITRQVDTKLKRLRKHIKYAEARFAKLKMDFNNYLSEKIIQNK